MNNLIARLERATEPDRMLDAHIALAVGLYDKMRLDPDIKLEIGKLLSNGSHELNVVGPHGGRVCYTEHPKPFTGSVDAAITLVPQGFEPHQLAFPHGSHRTFAFEIFPPTDHPAWRQGSIIGRGYTAPNAITVAALMAINSN